MCRITAFISPEPRAGADLLCGGRKSLLAQAAVRGRFQDDGWGIARFSGGVPSVTKSPSPARLETEAFKKAAAAPARVLVAHLRDASNPGNLTKKSLIGIANTQPFCGEGLVFAHNGTLYIKNEIRALLGKYAARVKGNNDSEVLFWQVVKMLDAYGSPELALEMALDEIRTVWISCKSSYPGRREPYLGLNLFLAGKDSLTVLCHAPRRDRKKALLTKGWELGRVAWRRQKDLAVFSSEPADERLGWKKMNDPEIARASLRGGKLELSFKRIKL
jgi:predicted glutamine amidotransferase